ncbi:class I SAM-dependent methyltransferase [Lysinibacillus sp. NPDC056232]|uniref:class I SAM-dependent methyltransferase n=1 Tax=Lysinibacillus sp. NPDC056232 TaxID=3345756 RepID=UPI0035D6AB3B
MCKGGKRVIEPKLKFSDKESAGRILRYFIQQCHQPSGLVGTLMINIWNQTFKAMTDWGIQNIDFQQTDYVLDVGCGGGETLNKLAYKVKKRKIYGVDISVTSVNTALSKNSSLVKNGRLKVLQSDVSVLPFESKYFDKVFAIQTHIYWGEFEKGLKEIERVLKDGGTFIMICEIDKIEYHMMKYKSSLDMMNLLKMVGFNSVGIYKDGNWIKFVCQKDLLQ